ncbi:hypothetical protein JOB18_035579 [Solea senegalensis]|uniref:Sushi domain-containing protein n=1 Tax=Solea senegalensis TaxID=28829 RepID=A0AAV6RWS9_SOLSE|nr:hypothetical protein JOB18_035579 [Solea senegalensis]
MKPGNVIEQPALELPFEPAVNHLKPSEVKTNYLSHVPKRLLLDHTELLGSHSIYDPYVGLLFTGCQCKHKWTGNTIGCLYTRWNNQLHFCFPSALIVSRYAVFCTVANRTPPSLSVCLERKGLSPSVCKNTCSRAVDSGKCYALIIILFTTTWNIPQLEQWKLDSSAK